MQAEPKSTGRFYRPELDVVRFLAFFFVFLHHTMPDGHDPRVAMLPAGVLKIVDAAVNGFGFGMSLFFVLSAFLICELLIRERQAVGTVGVKQFYIRRILRIWPLYYLALALGVVVAFLPGGRPSEVGTMGWFVIFLGAWRASIYAPLANPVNALWSISVEEQFYLLAPWVTKYLSRRLLFAFCIALVCCSNAWLIHLGHISASDSRIWFDTFVHFECFSAGILLCLFLKGGLPKLALWQRALALCCACLLWFIPTYVLHARFHAGINPGSWHLVAGYAMAALGAVLILIAFLGIRSSLLPAWAIYLGRISYGLYIFHVFAIYLFEHLTIGHRVSIAIASHSLRACVSGGVDLGLSLGLTLLLAAISYRYIETPFLKMKNRHAIIKSQPISADKG